MSEESAGKVEADCSRLFLWQPIELNDNSLYVSLVDTIHPRSIHRSIDLLRTAVLASKHSSFIHVITVYMDKLMRLSLPYSLVSLLGDCSKNEKLRY